MNIFTLRTTWHTSKDYPFPQICINEYAGSSLKKTRRTRRAPASVSPYSHFVPGTDPCIRPLRHARRFSFARWCAAVTAGSLYFAALSRRLVREAFFVRKRITFIAETLTLKDSLALSGASWSAPCPCKHRMRRTLEKRGENASFVAQQSRARCAPDASGLLHFDERVETKRDCRVLLRAVYRPISRHTYSHSERALFKTHGGSI